MEINKTDNNPTSSDCHENSNCAINCNDLATSSDDINSPNEHGIVPLHTAIVRNDMAMLESLLSRTNINIEYKTYKGETPLMMSLCSFRDDSFLLRLIEAGCDPTIPNKYGQVPLHIAMLRTSTAVAYELIKKGADVNAQDDTQRTPFCYAVDNNNMEGVCMLLYYGADVTIRCEDHMTPFTFALYMNRLEIARILFNFYDDFSAADSDGYTALHLATGTTNSLAIDLVNAGADVNCITNYGDSALVFSLKYDSAALFKLIWSKLDYHILLSSEKPFLLTYLETLCYSASEWLDCLYLILQSPVALKLVQHYQNYMNNSNIPGIFFILLYNFDCLKIEFVDRMAIINMCLYLRATVHLLDIDRAFEFFGFGDELEALIYALNWNSKKMFGPLNRFSLPMLNFILAMEDSCINEILESVLNVLESDINEGNVQNIRNVLGYFAIPLHKKQYLKSLWNLELNSDNYILNKFEQIPEIPSLLELSRNQAQKRIREIYNVKKPYQFHDAVKSMNLPQYIKDVVRFKIPIY